MYLGLTNEYIHHRRRQQQIKIRLVSMNHTQLNEDSAQILYAT